MLTSSSEEPSMISDIFLDLVFLNWDWYMVRRENKFN